MAMNDVRREVLIDATIDDVWHIVRQPGWWISDGSGDQSAMTFDATDEGTRVTHPRLGSFHLRTLEQDAPSRAVFGWAEGTAEDRTRAESCGDTTLEVTLEEVGGGVRVVVIERGFAAIDYEAHPNAVTREGNAQGWEVALRHLKANAEGPENSEHRRQGTPGA